MDTKCGAFLHVAPLVQRRNRFQTCTVVTVTFRNGNPSVYPSVRDRHNKIKCYMADTGETGMNRSYFSTNVRFSKYDF